MNSRMVLLAAAVAVIMAGCASPESQLQGTWKMDYSQQPNAQMYEAMEKAMPHALDLSFGPGKTWKSSTAAGRYTLSDRRLQLMVLQRSAEPGGPLEYTDNTPSFAADLSDDGRTLRMLPGQQQSAIFKKVP